MPIIGLAGVSVVAIVAGIRSAKPVNKLLVTAVWAVTVAFYMGIRP